MEVCKGWDFDDLLLLPKNSRVDHRGDVDLSVTWGNLHLGLPIVATPMKGIVGPKLIHELSMHGGLGILHRFFNSNSDWLTALTECTNEYNKFGFSVGLNDLNEEDITYGLDSDVSVVCVDVANGYLDSVAERVEYLANLIEKLGTKTHIMAGNVVTNDGCRKLWSAGADLIRVGIGSGGLCTTRNVTGVGCPQLTAIDNCKAPEGEYLVVADGGIRSSDDIVKALAAGADLVMMGSMFASCKESDNNGIIYGMASRKMQEEYFSSIKSVEGMEKSVEKTKSLSELLLELTWGMTSGFTYMDSFTIEELHKNAQWVSVGKGTIKEL